MQRLSAAWRHLGRGCQQLGAWGPEAGAAACGPAAECGGGGSGAAGLQWQQLRFASKKQGGSTQNTKDSNPKYLGVKLFGGQRCIPGNIIMRQRGTEFHPGANVGMGRDHTIFSLIHGRVKFHRNERTKRRFISVEPLESAVAAQQQQQQIAGGGAGSHVPQQARAW